MASGRTLQSTIEIAGVLSPTLQAAINNAVDKLDEMSKGALESAGAAEKLSAEILTQESVLKSLQKGYSDFVVSGQESSDEAQTLADKIQELSGELEDNKGTLAAAEKAAKRLADTQDDTTDSYTKLERKISDQEDDLEALRREYANVVLEQGKTSKEAKQLESKISSLSTELGKNRAKLKSVGDAAENAGRDASDASGGFTVLKGAISDLTADAIEKAVEAFKELALEGDKSLGLLQARTGASSSQMKGFEDVMYEVYNANYGESLDDVSQTLSTVIQMTDDLDNASLAQVTKSVIGLNDIFGFDTAESMRAVNSLMKNFGITSDEAFNLITQGAQSGLNQNDDLLDTINEYSVQFENAGFTANDMFNMLKNGTAEGTWSVDKLGDAVKEYNIRMSDGTASEALMKNKKALGLSWKEAKKLSAAFGEGGEAGAAAMQQTLDAILAVEDENKRYQLGVAMFGTMWEDLGEDTVKALFNTEGAIDSANEAMKQADSAAYDTLEASLSKLGRTIKAEVIQPIAEKLTPYIKDFADAITEKVGPAVDWMMEHMPALAGVLGVVGAAFAAIKVVTFAKNIGKIFGLFKGGGLGGLFGGDSGGGGGGIFSSFANLAKTNVSSILKGMANLSIIVVGLGALATVIAWAAPYVTSLCESDQFLKLMAAIAIVGVVGAGMSKLAGSVGNIPVATVAKGLANIAIVMVGLGALTAVIAWVAPAVTKLSDAQTFGELLLAIGAVGLVGSALTGLAGLVGAIPIATVTSGLANIALVLAGFTGIVTAFGALSKIEGFNDFLTSGGETLTTLCNILGQMVGAVIGGLGEGITASLPTIGDNLSAFATSVQPMFDTFAKVDTASLSDFALAFAAFIGVIAGEQILGIFTGGIDYEGLGTKLSSMATSLSGFFDTIMTFPEGGFEKAKALFDCLAGISSMPKEGGVVGWFQGEVDYSKMATGLTQLAGSVGFFTAIQDIPDGAFTKAKSLFDCLGGISSLPQDGGVVGWFQGEVDYSKMATGLQTLASAGMIAALTAIGGLPATAFTGLTSLFKALAGVNSMPKEGGIAGWFSGDSTTGLTSVASQLPGVATHIATFFSNLGGITNFTPIKSLFDTLGSIEIDSNAADKGFLGLGSSAMETMGAGLSSFATNAAPFFEKINGFNVVKMAMFFNQLSTVGGLPSTLATLDVSIGTALSNIATTTETKMNEIRDAINLDTSEKNVSGSMTTISGSMSTNLGAALKTATEKFQNIFTTIKSKINSAKNAVVSAIEAMKKVFNFSWKLPHLKLPHLTISGDWSFNPPKVPKFSVKWFAEGGIMTQPTAFGAIGNTVLAGGEAGAEAIVPLQTLWDKLEAMIRAVFNSASTTGSPSDAGLTSKAGELLTLDSFSLGSLVDGTSIVIYYDFSNFTWSPQIQTGGSEEETDFMAMLKAHEAEFFDWLEEFIQMREVAQYA